MSAFFLGRHIFQSHAHVWATSTRLGSNPAPTETVQKTWKSPRHVGRAEVEWPKWSEALCSLWVAQSRKLHQQKQASCYQLKDLLHRSLDHIQTDCLADSGFSNNHDHCLARLAEIKNHDPQVFKSRRTKPSPVPSRSYESSSWQVRPHGAGGPHTAGAPRSKALQQFHRRLAVSTGEGQSASPGACAACL